MRVRRALKVFANDRTSETLRRLCRRAQKSAMPANYKARLSAAEINALVAYLARQTARPVEIAAK